MSVACKGIVSSIQSKSAKVRYLAGAEEKLKLRLLEPRAALSDQGSGLEEFSVDVVKGKPLQLHIGRLGKRGLGAHSGVCDIKNAEDQEESEEEAF